MGQDGKVQNPTTLFRLMGVDVERLRAHYGSDTIMGDEVGWRDRLVQITGPSPGVSPPMSRQDIAD